MDPITIAIALAQFAPKIAGWLGGDKAEQVAEKAVAVAQAVTGHESPTEALQALQADPAKALEYRQAILAQETEFERLAVRREEIAADDRKDARKLVGGGDTTARNLAYLIVSAFIGMCFAVLYDQAKVDSVLAGTIIGYLSAKAEQVASFYFGSSAGSKAKDEAMARAATR